MLNTAYECNEEDNTPVRVPLMKLQMPRIKTAIHKRKDWIDPSYEKKKVCLAIKRVPEKMSFRTVQGCKKQLTIRIPSDTEVTAFTPGSRVKTVSNYADTNEAGMFYGVTLKKGSYRRSNEDRFITHPYFAGKHTNLMVGVFDGHGGEHVSQYLSECFTQRFLSRYSFSKDVTQAFHETFEMLDSELKSMAESEQIPETAGSTATSALLLDDDLYLSYVGDSAAILTQNHGERVLELCPELDTAEDNPQEVARVENAGGVVLKVGHTARVQGELALTRTLGASKYKPYVTAEPHLAHYCLCEEDSNEFLVIATDGMWKALSSAEVAKIVTENKGIPENEIAERLYEEAVKRNSMDNITIVVIDLEKRTQLKKEGTFGPPPAPTSRYTKENRKTFLFP